MSKGLVRLRLLKVTRCQDGMMWYASLVGEYVPCLGLANGEWKSRAPSGYSNFIAEDNARVVHVLVSANRLGEYPYKYAQVGPPIPYVTPPEVVAKLGCKDRCKTLGVCNALHDCELPLVPPMCYAKEGSGIVDSDGGEAALVGQSHAHTTAEVATNIVLGFGISVAITAVLLPAMGHQVTLTENVAMTSVFTVASFARAYGLRRLFNWLQLRGQGAKP